jgi:hypothetical protein
MEHDRKFEVPVYYDGPFLHAEATITVAARDKQDAMREAMILVGPPKVGEVKEIQ